MRTHRFQARWLAGLCAVLTVLLLGYFLYESQLRLHREETLWQQRLQAEAAQMSEAAQDWLAERAGVMERVAANPTIRLFLTQWELAGGETAQIQDAQAQRFFTEQALAMQMQRFVPASAATENGTPPLAGLLLFDTAGRLVAQAGNLPEALRLAAQRSAEGSIHAQPLKTERGEFLLWQRPLPPIQPETERARAGYVIGVMQREAALAPLFARYSAGWPLPRHTRLLPGMQTAPAETPETEELRITQPLDDTDWLLRHAVTREAALGGAIATRNQLVIALALAVLCGVLYLATRRSRAAEPLADTQTAEQLIAVMADIIDSRDPCTAHHSQQVAALSAELAAERGEDEAGIRLAEYGGLLMNVGKVLISDDILTSFSRISPSQRREIQSGIARSAELMEGIRLGGRDIARIIRQSMEHVDGSGPLGLKGDAIDPTARLLHVANSYVALTHRRVYRDSLNPQAALETLKAGADREYDATIVQTLEAVLARRAAPKHAEAAPQPLAEQASERA